MNKKNSIIIIFFVGLLAIAYIYFNKSYEGNQNNDIPYDGVIYYSVKYDEAKTKYPNIALTLDVPDKTYTFQIPGTTTTLTTFGAWAIIPYQNINVSPYSHIQEYMIYLKRGGTVMGIYDKDIADTYMGLINNMTEPDLILYTPATTPGTNYAMTSDGYTKDSVLSYLNQVDSSMAEYLRSMFDTTPKCPQVIVTTPKPTCPPVPKCLNPEPIKCVADFGTNIGDKLSGGKGVLQDTRHVCPNTLKKCSNFKCGSAFGTCTSE